MSSDQKMPLVIDNGSGITKAGFSGDDAPRSVFPAVVGRQADTCYIGDEAINKRDTLTLTHPVDHGLVTNWEDMEKLWNFIFTKELRVKPEEHAVLLVDAPLNPTSQREKMAQIMFEQFKVPSFYVANQAVLSLYASGRYDGMVLGSGDGVTYTVPIFQGYALTEAISRSDQTGKEITNLLKRSLTDKGYSFASKYDLEIKDMKEKLCYIADEQAQVTAPQTRTYELPDGNIVSVDRELVTCPEIMFKPLPPQTSGEQAVGIHQMVVNSIKKCEQDVHKAMYENVILSGGSTMFPGLADRLKKELTTLAPNSFNVRVIAPPERKCTVWIGGSIMTSLDQFKTQWVTKQEYEEVGTSIIGKTCP